MLPRAKAETTSSKLMIDGHEIEPCGEIKLGKEALIHLDTGYN